MAQDFKANKKRVKRFRLTCNLIDDSGKVHYFQDGHEYVEIGGIKWATCNVGAEKETDNGLYFQWGDIQGYTADQVGNNKEKKSFILQDYKYGNNTTMTKYNSTDGKTVLEISDDAARFHMGGSWRMPTEEDFQTLLMNTTNKQVTNYQGTVVNGWLFTSKTDNSKVLFFPACGFCSSGRVNAIGFFGYYWSSFLSSLFNIYSRNLALGSKYYDIGSNSRYIGFSVRGVFK